MIGWIRDRRAMAFVVALVLLPTVAVRAADVPGADRILETLKPEHPRLLIDGAGFDRLKKLVADDVGAKRLYDALRKEADGLLDEPPSEYVIPDGKRLLRTSRRVLDRVRILAVVYRISGDRKYLDRAWAELDAAAKFKDWNPSHFLDTGEMTHAFAVGYDWLYHDWTDAQRRALRDAIVELGLTPGLACYEGRERYGWWVKATHNWNQVCNGGMLAGALAVGDVEPELAGKIVAGAVESLPRALVHYGPDGGWGEGPGYWHYATNYTVLALASLDSALGRDFGLSRTPGIAETGRFGIYCTGPIGRTFSFADSGDSMNNAPFMRWLAERYDRPAYHVFASQRPRIEALDLVWYRPVPKVDAPPRSAYFRGTEVVTMRSAWDDADATFVGFQAGSNNINHNHLDLGSFVLDALGERWVVDMKHDDYNLPGYFGRQRYEYYRNRAESHNTLLIGPTAEPDQDPRADCRIERFSADGPSPYAIAELTPAYSKATRVKRGIRLLDGGGVLVADEIKTREPTDVYWLLHTPAKVTLSEDGRRATLAQGGKTIAVHLLGGPKDLRFTVDEAGPFPWSPRPNGQDETPGLRRLVIHAPNVIELSLGVRIDVGKGPHDAQLTPLSDW